MGMYRLENIAQLARQMRFTPIPRRLDQLALCEDFLLQLQPDQTYTIDQVVLAITGYQSRRPDATLLTGVALQHDLGLLMEQVSDSLQLHVNSSPEPILTIDDAAQRLAITTKTIQRWRRRGLPARRFTFTDGKRRIGFRLSTLQRFLGSTSAQELPAYAAGGLARPRTLTWLTDRATCLASRGYWRSLVGHRLGRAGGMSPTALAAIVREHVGQVDFALEPTPELRRQVVELDKAGQSHRQIASALSIPSFGVYRIVLESRIHRLQRKPLRFIDDPLYHQDDAAAAIDQIVGQQVADASAEITPVPRDLPPYLRDVYRIATLTPAQERGLFLRYHYLRYLASQAIQLLDPQLSRWSQVGVAQNLLQNAAKVRGQIVAANLRLVVSVARKHARPGALLMELASEGNMVLMRAVDTFDIHRGHRFSTYGVYALMKAFARCIPAMLAQQSHLASPESLPERCDPSTDLATRTSDLREEVNHLISRLDRREQDILSHRFGLNAAPQTFQQIGSRHNLSRQRIVQIERQALAKLRDLAQHQLPGPK